ncbi:hypothetical protein MRX96_022317 [Rhipicephalus microplus]
MGRLRSTIGTSDAGRIWTRSLHHASITKQKPLYVYYHHIYVEIPIEVQIEVQIELSATVEPQRTSAVESTLEALVLVKLEPISAQIGDTFTTLSHRRNTHTAQINDLKSKLTNFVVQVTNNCISHAELEDCHDRKNHAQR